MREKLFILVAKELKVPIDKIYDELAVGSIPEWDSLAHVGLIAAVEKEFNVQFDMDDVFEIEEVIDFVDLLNEKIKS